MMETATRQRPQAGRSRFSKVLPVPPSFSERSTSLPQHLPPRPTARKELPATPAASKLALPLPPKQSEEGATVAPSKPPQSPLPPLPSKAGSSAPSMAIPRRPVGNLASPTEVAPPEVSPVTSLSSLLSAYSNRSSDSTPRSSTGNSADDIPSAKGPGPVAPFDREGNSNSGQGGVKSEEIRTVGAANSTLHASHDIAEPQNDGSRPPAKDPESAALPPPPPLKDAAPGPRPAQQSQIGARKPPSLMDMLMNKAPSEPQQIWRRRSLKGDKTIEVSELKLADSHGSTAASTQRADSQADSQTDSQATTTHPAAAHPAAQQPATQEQTQPSLTANTQTQISRARNISLPGRNVRPSAPQPQPQPVLAEEPQKEAAETMGQEHSHFKLRKSRSRDEGEEHGGLNGRKGDAGNAESLSNANGSPPVVSLPASDSDQEEDFLGPMLDHYLSTPSPVASPSPSPGLPSTTTQKIQRKAVGTASVHEVRQAKSSPVLADQAAATAAAAAAADNTSAQPIAPSAGAARVPKGLPSNPAAGRNKASDASPFPSRTSSKIETAQSRLGAAGGRRDLTDPRTSNMTQPQDANSHVRQLSMTNSVASIETLRPTKPSAPPAAPQDGEESPLTDNPGVALFPRNWYTPRATDEMLDALPLGICHFECYVRHKDWVRSGQRYNPISCRACGYKDYMNDYWMCTHCALRVCINCRNDLLQKFKGDLRRMVEEIERRKAATTAGKS